MKLACVGAGACFANVVEDVLAKCRKNKDSDFKWKVLYEALQRPGPGPQFEVHYVDCGPELARAKQKGEVFTYDISKGGLLSGAGHVGTGEKFFHDAQWSVVRDLQTNLSKNPPGLFLSIRGGGATNCGAGFQLDREILGKYENSVLLQFIILPYRGEGIEASRVVYLAWQVLELLREYPDRYAPVVISNEQILAGAQSFEKAGMNWFYPLANTIVADVLARILYPTLYAGSGESGAVEQGAFELDSRQKYLDIRDFVRQPGFRSVGYAHLDDTVPLDPKALGKLVKDSLGALQVGKIPDSEELGLTGNLSPMTNPLTAFALLTGPRGAVGDITKAKLSGLLEDELPGSFPRAYAYDITPGKYEFLLFPGGGVPDDIRAWCERFGKNLRNPRYKDVVSQATHDFARVCEYHEKLCAQFQIKPA
ncbi:MAG: hypothetical protein HYY17_00750 [Planctomycetes bacterium]|nr:hypothetical protein [Planctomycetota bacterium]